MKIIGTPKKILLLSTFINGNYYILLFLFIIGWNKTLDAQSLTPFSPSFSINGKTLQFPNAGGISSPQFSAVDLNNDGIEDLFVYDKIGQNGLTFINRGTANQVDYHYAPEYLDNFPTLVEWVVLRDYNGDGAQDIFAYSSTPGIPGIEVYTGYFDENDRIAFKQFNFNDGDFNIIYYPGNSGLNNLFVSNIDYPAIDDIDGDGDLDIVTFNVAGGVVELYENQSLERGFGLDSLEFILVDRCWGKFFESGLGLEIDLSSDINTCATEEFTKAQSRNGPHAGSTVLTLDMDNDGDKEVILGDISFTNLNLLTNGGNNEQAFMIAQEIDFPNNSVPVDLPIFPAGFHLDVNNDGIKDLIASPNLGNDIGETYEVGWYYQNVSNNDNPVFEWQQNDFLVEDMVDFGTGAYPVFVDVNADGLLDLVAGNKSFFVPQGAKDARIFLFENIGTPTQPAFQLVDDDYLGLNVFSNNAWRFAPAFGDLDGDGDQDALVGEEFGNLFFLENIAGPNQPFAFAEPVFGYQNIDVGQANKPQIIDVNKDGLLDLVIGERNGNLNYYQNEGSLQNPVFPSTQTSSFFGEVDARIPGFITGFSAPVLLEIDGVFQLFVGSESGQLKLYGDIENNLTGAFTKISEDYGNLKIGQEIHPAFADIDEDGFLEMAVGNVRGGINFYNTDLKSNITSAEEILNPSLVRVFPNPLAKVLNIQIDLTLTPERVILVNTLGQQVLDQPFSNVITLTDLDAGIYFLEIQTREGKLTRKIIKK